LKSYQLSLFFMLGIW